MAYSVFKDTEDLVGNAPDPVGFTSDRPPKQVRDTLKLSPSDLVEDPEHLKTIKTYMATRYGLGVADNRTDEDIVDKFVNHMRNYKAGNSITTLSETAWLAKADEETRAVAGQAYGTFDKLGNLFGEQNSLSEKVDGVFDYAKATILDPTNLVAFGAGRLASTFTGKLAGRYARKKAQEAVVKLGPNATEAKKAKVFNDYIQKSIRAARINEGASARAKKEIGASVATEAALSLGIDTAFQNGMIMSMQQEDWSRFQTGLAAIGGLVGGSVSAFSLGVRATSKEKGLLADAPTTKIAAKVLGEQKDAKKKVGKSLQGILENTVKEYTTLKQKSAQYKNVKEALKEDPDLKLESPEALDEVIFWRMFFLGDDMLGVKGLAHSIEESGVVWKHRWENDNITNWAADIISENLDGNDLDMFIATAEQALAGRRTKALLPNFKKDLQALEKLRLKEKKPPLTQKQKLEFFSNRMANKISDGGKYLNIMRQFAGRIAKKQKDVTAEDIMENSLEPIPESMLKKIRNRYDWVQNVIIRNIVTNPGTTALNLTGWSAYSTLQSTADVIKAALYSGTALTKMALGMKAESKGLYLSRVLKLQTNKIRNMLDPETSVTAFLKYLEARPEAQKELMRYLSGGVDNATFIKQFGFDPEDTVIGRSTENFTNFMQTIWAVRAVDIYTKSVEFMYNIEKGLIKNQGKTYNEFVNDTPNLANAMNIEEYINLEAKAVGDTLSSVFSKKHGGFWELDKDKREWVKKDTFDLGKAPLASFAKAVEDFRKIPVLGLNIPFGQFFNNTIAFMAYATPLGTGREIYKHFTQKSMLKYGVKPAKGEDADIADAVTKGALGMAALRYWSDEEMQDIDEGLAWSEKRDEETGMIRDVKYDYPYSLYKMAGRITAHYRRGDIIPKDLVKTFLDTFTTAQFTRQFKEYDLGIGLVVKGITEREYDLTREGIAMLFGNTLAQGVSGLMRSVDPLNQVVGLAQGEDYKAIDRKQGSKILNNSLRYVDNIVASLGITLAPEKYKGTTGEPIKSEITKVLGYREVSKHSYTQRMFNAIGKPEWRTDVFSRVPEADNRMNELLFGYVEQEAAKLFNSKLFKSANMRVRTRLVSLILENAKKSTKNLLRSSPILKDRRLEMAYSITRNRSRADVARYLKHFGGVDDIMDLDLQQLMMLNELIGGEKKAAKNALRG